MNTAGKWVLGCGVGCGLVIVLLATAGIGSCVWLTRSTSEPMERAVETRQTLAERHAEAYTPPPGWVRPERLDAFLGVRERLADARERLKQAMLGMAVTPERAQEMETQGFLEGLRSGWEISKSAVAFAPALGRYFAARNEALLAEDMGLGEYSWLYALSYWSFLGHDPTASIDDAEEFAGAPEGEGPMGLDVLGTMALPRLRDDLRAMFRRAAEAHGGKAAVAELERLEENPHRIPWQDGLPDDIAATLEPRRDALERTWSAAVNGMALAINEKTGYMSYSTR
jgi:hypothetical protein